MKALESKSHRKQLAAYLIRLGRARAVMQLSRLSMPDVHSSSCISEYPPDILFELAHRCCELTQVQLAVGMAIRADSGSHQPLQKGNDDYARSLRIIACKMPSSWIGVYLSINPSWLYTLESPRPTLCRPCDAKFTSSAPRTALLDPRPRTSSICDWGADVLRKACT